MRANRRLLFAAVVLGIILVLGWFLFRAHESTFEGKSIRAWVNYELHEDAHAEWGWRGSMVLSPGYPMTYDPKDKTFSRLLNERPAEVLPYLIAALKTEDSRTRHIYQWLSNHLPGFVSRHLPILTPPSHIRGTAATILGSMGPAARDAVPALCDCLSKDPMYYEKYRIIQAIVAIGPEGKAVVPTFIRLLQKDPETPVRVSACVVLGMMRSNPAEVVPALTKALDDTNNFVRMYAMSGLSKFGPEAKSAEKALRELAVSTNIFESQQARAVLQKIVPPAPATEQVIK